MAIATPVSKPRAALDFMNNWGNTLLVGGCLTYLAGRVVLPLLGKSAENHPYLAKMNAKFASFWAFADFAKVSSSIFVGVSDVMILKGGRTNQEIREGEWDAGNARWVHRPNAEMTLNGNRYTWVAYRSLATLLKMFSAYVLVHEGLKAVGALKTGPSSMMKAYGATAGLAGLGIDLYDVQSRKNDYRAHNLSAQLMKVGVNKGEFDGVYINDLRWSQAVKVVIMGVKVMALLSALSKAELGGLAGRVMKNPYMGKVLENSNDIFNGLFIGLTGVLFAQQVHVGANKDKWTADNGTWWAKYALKSFTDSRDFVRLVEGTATTLIDLGYDALAETDLGALGKFAKSFDSFLYVPKVSERVGGLVDVASGKKFADFRQKTGNAPTVSRKIWIATYTTIKFLGDTFAALKFIGAFGGVAYLSGRVKGLGYLKNGFSSIGAIMTISEEVFFPARDWSVKNKKQMYISSAIIAASLGSLFLNGMGGLAAAFGDKITVPDVNKNFKPWVYNFAKVNSTALVAINNFISASAA
ncbi:MAG: hypothetical protein KFB95_09695 [Simkaniaceae bacterium]|nr:MAG: hypothetical protein KFB95_09695 [Simkaniaceae bacterium]